jgi:hypothetical protein
VDMMAGYLVKTRRSTTTAGMIAAMLEEPEGPQDADGPKPARRWRWAAPIGAAVLVVGVVVGILVAQPSENDPPAAGSRAAKQEPKPRFMVSGDRSGAVQGTAGSPWLQVYDLSINGQPPPVASVPPPSPTAGEVTSIVAGPDRTFVVAALRAKECETVLYRFRLTDDGQVENIEPVAGGTTPTLLAGLAISPDGRRIAYATAPCSDAPAERALPATTPITLAVLDPTGQVRTWTSRRPTIIGQIVWAGDSRTIGYTTGEVTPPASPPPTGSRDVPRGARVGAIQVRALHTEAPGTDLLDSRVLFDQSDKDDTVETAVMGRDGRTGYGMLHRGQPPSTVMFTFGEGQPMRVTNTIPADPRGNTVMVSVVSGGEPRYACLDGVDAFGRADDGELRSSRGTRGCATAYDIPE